MSSRKRCETPTKISTTHQTRERPFRRSQLNMAKKKNKGRGRKRPKPQGGRGSNENSCPHATRRLREAAGAKASFEKWEADMTAASEARRASDEIKERAARRRAEQIQYFAHIIATARECSREAAELARRRQMQRQRVRIIAETAAASARQRQSQARDLQSQITVS